MLLLPGGRSLHSGGLQSLHIYWAASDDALRRSVDLISAIFWLYSYSYEKYQFLRRKNSKRVSVTAVSRACFF